LWQRRRPLFIYLAVAGAARLLPSPVIEPRDRQHVALVELGELGEGTAQLRAVGALAVSLKTFSAPAARNCFTCASTLWPSVDKPADSATEFCNKKALNNQPSEFVSNILIPATRLQFRPSEELRTRRTTGGYRPPLTRSGHTLARRPDDMSAQAHLLARSRDGIKKAE